MSTLMTERRRPLENDDGQGALFGGEAFAPAGPAPAWKRPARPEVDAPASAGAAPFQAGVDAGVQAPPAADPGSPASQGFEPGAQRAEAGLAPPRGFEPGAQQFADRALDRTRAFEGGSGGAAARALDPDAGGSGPSAPFADEIAELERATEGHAPRRPRAPLAGPTLDDVMSRVWEGLATGLPAACPVCQGEVVPALSGPPQGRCSSCGTTID